MIKFPHPVKENKPHRQNQRQQLNQCKQLNQRQHQKGIRQARGAALGLVIVSAFLLVACILGLFQLSMLMGGSRQVRNAVDAGVLNISKRIVEVKIPVTEKFTDVADSTGSVSLSNVNRIWGKAYLINANAEAMKADGQANSDTQAGADGAYALARNLNDALFNQVSSDNVLNLYFQQLAHQREARMLGEGTKVERSKVETCSIAMVDRGAESNLSFSGGQMPGRVSPKSRKFGGKSFFSGYVPMKANEKDFCFTSFRQGEMPHLIDDAYFENNSAVKPTGSSYSPLPNAFKRYGEVEAPAGKLTAVACAVANPQRSYNVAIPYSFVTIQIGNTAKWYVEGKKIKETTYGFKTEEQKEIKDFPLSTGGKLYGNASLGNEYSAASTLLDVINAVPGNHNSAFKKLVQRVQEIDPAFSMEKLMKLLESQVFTKTSADGSLPPSKYFIYPTYTSPDKTDPTIKIGSSKGDLPSWLNPDNPPDGLEKLVMQEDKMRDKPNFCWCYVVGGSSPTVKHYTDVYGNIMWQPGTGYGQHLGELRFARLTEIYFGEQNQTAP